MSRWSTYYFNRCRLDDDTRRGFIYHVQTDSRGVRPSKKIEGDYVAYVTHVGIRMWAFKELINRDKFIDKYPEAKRLFSEKEKDVIAAKRLASLNL